MTAEKALAALKDGNNRFCENIAQHPHEDPTWRHSLAGGQEPFAAVLACADSRLTPEIIFDQGLGDLFVIRVAGNVARSKVLGSLEYAVAQLNVPLIVVLGHESCGAVQASFAGGTPPGHLGAIVEAIKPAVYMARLEEGDQLAAAVRYNARLTAEHIKEAEPILAPAVQENRLRVVPSFYHLSSGRVDFFEA